MTEREEKVIELLRELYIQARKGEIESNLMYLGNRSNNIASTTVKKCIDRVIDLLNEPET